ncbi:hypothetical protein OEZ86_011775 [Tetradesmus obliquus]|nr:hypothetical protein OEZ86_011775 [Tetradesmus obliquus]
MAAPEMYTRGQPGDQDNRGESLVQQHMDRMQQQKEAVAMEKLRLLLPQMGDMVRALALARSEWDIDKAVQMLRSFHSANLDKVNLITKKRKKIKDDIENYDEPKEGKEGAAAGKASHSGSSSGGSSSSSGSESDSDAEERKSKKRRRSSSKHKKDKAKDKKRRKDKKHKKQKDKDKDKDQKRKKRKQAASEDEEAGGKARGKLTHTEDFGKYGYIRETDQNAKHDEFVLWAVEVKGANIELLGKTEEKELFREYMEDFNTGTLPHKKYYDLAAFERSEKIKAAGGGSGGGKPGGAAFDARADEEALKKQRHEERMRLAEQRQREAYALLKHTDRAKDMREQELLRAEMNLAYKTGDRAKAEKIFQRLQPDEEKKK